MDAQYESQPAIGEPAAPAPEAPRSRMNRDILFTDAKGKHKPRLEKAVTKQLKVAAPLVSGLLEPGEQIQYITQACSPFNLLEFLTTGWIVLLLKASFLVVTDRRLLHLPMTPFGKLKASVSQIRFEDVETFKISGIMGARLRVKYRNGKKEDFTSVKRLAANKLKTLLPAAGRKGISTATAGRHHLCPKCALELTKGQSRCSGCQLEFKNSKKAAWLSLLVPGGGYFYTGHPILGVLDALAEIILILAVLAGVFLTIQGDSEGLSLLVFFGVIFAVEKLVTIYHSQHFVAEFLPTDTSFLRT